LSSGGEIGLDVDGIRRELADDAGRLEPLGLGRVVTGAGAVDGLAEVIAGLTGGAVVVVLAAATPISADGRDLRGAVEQALDRSFAVDWVVLGPDDGQVHADEATVAAATAAAADAGCVITVGSGTITDIGKAAAPAGTPLVTVQTATSVNGYADPFSVLLRHGVKRTTPSRWPDALIIDPAVLQDAPPDLNRAGAGDMMAMFTATADWYLASAIAGRVPGTPAAHPGDALAPGSGRHPGDPPPKPGSAAHPGDPPYLPAVAKLVRARGPRLLELAAAAFPSSPYGPPASGAPVPEDRCESGAVGCAPNSHRSCALAELAGILTLSGIAMGVAGSTAPASGMEHAVSHLLEMAAAARGEPASFHGTQVGVASVVAAQTWAHVLRLIADGALSRPAALPDPDDVSGRIGRAFAAIDPSGAMAAECFADYAKKLRRLGSGGDPLAGLRASWPAHHEALAGILTDPATLVTALRTAGLPARFCDLAEPVDDETARWAVANSPLMRQRFGVADLAMLLGAWEDTDVEAVLAGTTVGQGQR
jgi:glycerol-1-phosphate dehydrogenase [NAD(P)+]